MTVLIVTYKITYPLTVLNTNICIFISLLIIKLFKI